MLKNIRKIIFSQVYISRFYTIKNIFRFIAHKKKIHKFITKKAEGEEEKRELKSSISLQKTINLKNEKKKIFVDLLPVHSAKNHLDFFLN